jgi:hypothetical protein
VTAIAANRPTTMLWYNWKVVNTVLTYNPVTIDDRNEQPFLIAVVAIFAVWTVALLIAVA